MEGYIGGIAIGNRRDGALELTKRKGEEHGNRRHGRWPTLSKSTELLRHLIVLIHASSQVSGKTGPAQKCDLTTSISWSVRPIFLLYGFRLNL